VTPTEPQASPAKARPFVTGSWPLEDHPAYGDDVLVGRVTDSLLAQGRTVFQLFMLDPDERLHAQAVLQHVFLPIDGSVLSLGCGVGGMERHWVDAMPNVEVTLVNQSMAQLARRVCPGRLVLADMRDPISWGGRHPGNGYDLVVLGYSLHHVDDVPAMLAVAYSALRPGGTLLVLDVCGGSEALHEALQYRTLDAAVLAHCGLVRLDHGLTWHRQPDEVIGAQVGRLLDAGAAWPGMWVGLA
jgi:SAM-dependent methyltransferase